MSKIPKNLRQFKLQTIDLLLQLNVAAGVAEEVATEVMRASTKESSADVIRSMLLDSLRKRDAKAAKQLASRFEFVEQRLQDIPREKVEPGEEIYDEEALDELLEADEITAAELYFMEGYKGRAWQRKTDHIDTVSTELAEDDRFED
ncbi:MAG: hypothetical protein ACFE9D_04260 [Promethearchaeota archaeon]